MDTEVKNNTNTPKGVLVSFDGLDSSGKATQVRLFCERLKASGREVLKLETPDYTTPSGQDLKMRLQGKVGDWHNTSWQEKLGYFATNRAEHKEEVLNTLTAGGVVVYDRYVPSSLIFMEVEAGSDEDRKDVHETVESVEYGDNGMPHEVVSIFLDVPPAIALKLLGGRKQQRGDEDEYTDTLEVQQRMYDAYVRVCNEQPQRMKRIICIENGALLSPEAIAETIWHTLEPLLS